MCITELIERRAFATEHIGHFHELAGSLRDRGSAVRTNKMCSVAAVFLSVATFATVYFSVHVLAEEKGHKISNIHRTQTSYDAVILSDRPVLFLNLGNSGERSFEVDEAGSGARGAYLPLGSKLSTVKMPNGDLAPEFDGATQYLEVASSPRLSITTTGVLTIEAWIAPKTLQFGHEQGSGYVYWLGKGEPSQYMNTLGASTRPLTVKSLPDRTEYRAMSSIAREDSAPDHIFKIRSRLANGFTLP